MKFTILKNVLNNKLHNLNFNPVNAIKSDFHKISNRKVKKLLITELSVSLSEIKTKHSAEMKLTKKISYLIKKYNLEIPSKNLSKITYYAIRDFIYLGKIEPLMRDHMVEEISCDGTNIPLYIWHREFESIPTNILFETDKELNNF